MFREVDRFYLAPLAARDGLSVYENPFGKSARAVRMITFQLPNVPCTLAISRIASGQLPELSKELGIVIGAYMYEKVNDSEQMDIYADGQLIEHYSFGDGGMKRGRG